MDAAATKRRRIRRASPSDDDTDDDGAGSHRAAAAGGRSGVTGSAGSGDEGGERGRPSGRGERDDARARRAERDARRPGSHDEDEVIVLESDSPLLRGRRRFSKHRTAERENKGKERASRKEGVAVKAKRGAGGGPEKEDRPPISR
jgi:hypothetical protein